MKKICLVKEICNKCPQKLGFKHPNSDMYNLCFLEGYDTNEEQIFNNNFFANNNCIKYKEHRYYNINEKLKKI
jgi:hypothetical protein